MKPTLIHVQNIHATLEDGREILRGVDLTIPEGEVHVIMGPNGSGKSTLANVIMGSPAYQVTEGTISIQGEDITEASVDQRAKKGIFLAFQSAEEIDGITMTDFLRTASIAVSDTTERFTQFQRKMKENLADLKLDSSYSQRYLNVGFSGGEKKKSEVLQLLTLRPKFAMLDETDSGLDVDAVQVVTDGILKYKNERNALLIISHSTRLLERLPVDAVHILYQGRFIHHGTRELINEVNENGFAGLIQEAQTAAADGR